MRKNECSPVRWAGKSISCRPSELVRSLADVGHQRHEACSLDGVFDGALESGAVTAALAAEQLALGGAELFKSLNVFIVHKGWPWTSFFGTEPAAILPAPSEFLANHVRLCPHLSVEIPVPIDGSITIATKHPGVNEVVPTGAPLDFGERGCVSVPGRLSHSLLVGEGKDRSHVSPPPRPNQERHPILLRGSDRG